MLFGDEADDSARAEPSRSELYDERGAYREAVPPWQEPEHTLEQREMMGVLRLRFHLVMCNNCRHAEQQLQAIRSAIRAMFDDPPDNGEASNRH